MAAIESDVTGSQPPETVSQTTTIQTGRRRGFLGAMFRIEWMITVGLILTITYIIYTVRHLSEIPSAANTDTIQKLIGLEHYLCAALTSWGTQIITTMIHKDS